MSNFLCGLTRNNTPHSMENLAFCSFTQMRDDYTTNSHYLTPTFLFRRVGRMYFLNLGVKGLIGSGRIKNKQPNLISRKCRETAFRSWHHSRIHSRKNWRSSHHSKVRLVPFSSNSPISGSEAYHSPTAIVWHFRGLDGAQTMFSAVYA